jgi:hypothetical protein
MPIFLIFGFDYENQLPSSKIDVKKMYRWCTGFCEKGYIITDFETDFELCKKYKQIVSKSFDTIIDHFKNFLLKNIDNKFFIYFTGHGKDKSFMFPNSKLLPFLEFRNLIELFTESNSEIFILTDCCRPGTMNLPFQLKNNKFELEREKINFSKHNIILIISQDENNKSLATEKGSFLTKSFLKSINWINNTEIQDKNLISYIYSKNRNFSRISNKIKKSIKKSNKYSIQNIYIYSSYMNEPIIWNWLGDHKYNKNIEFYQNYLIIEK